MKKTIVVAEDSLILSMVVKRYLINEGYAVCVFGNGRDALLFLQQNEADLLITDLEMPVLDGWGLIEQVGATIPGRLPVIVMSDCNREDMEKQVIGRGASAYIGKPFTNTDLISCIKQLEV